MYRCLFILKNYAAKGIAVQAMNWDDGKYAKGWTGFQSGRKGILGK